MKDLIEIYDYIEKEAQKRVDRIHYILNKLKKKENPKSRIVRFPDVFQELCPLLFINKKKAWKYLFMLKNAGHIEIVPYQGIKICS